MNRYEYFQARPILFGLVINLSQLDASNCLVSPYLKTQKLSLFFTLCGIEVYEKIVTLSYASLCNSRDS